MQVLDDVRVWWAARVARQPGSRVQCDDLGLTYFENPTNSGSEVRLLWAEVTTVFAYKRDCYTVDSIHIILGDEDQKRWVDIEEGVPGYRDLVSALPRKLHGCPTEDEWFPSVAFPPFEKQWTQLYPGFGAVMTTPTAAES